MNGQEKLYQSITNIDEEYLDEMQRYKPVVKIHRRPILIAACLAITLLLCGFGYATFWGTGSADGISFHALTQDFSTEAGDVDTVTENDNEVEKSDLITDYSNIFAANFVSYSTDNGKIPSIYFSPNYMVIFTKGENGGWTLEAGEEITFSLNLNKKQSLSLEFGYVLDGKYYPLFTLMGNTFSDTFNALEGGEYYFCVTNRSSANAVTVGGNIG